MTNEIAGLGKDWDYIAEQANKKYRATVFRCDIAL
jgi:hypothetical protein